VVQALGGLRSAAGFCWQQADRCRAGASRPGLDAASQLLYTLDELAWRVLAGVPAGIVGGYLSHLALDAGTPRRIPLLGL
jgi:hypothetical protein